MSASYEHNFRVAFEGVIKAYGKGLTNCLKKGASTRALDKLIQKEMVSERSQSGNLLRKSLFDETLGIKHDICAIAGSYHGAMAGYYSLLADIHGCVPLSSRSDGSVNDKNKYTE